MAQQTRRRGGAAEPNGGTPEQQKEDDEKVTKRVVLKRERVIVVPDHIDIEQAVQALKAADSKRWGKGTEAVEAWIVVGEYEGKSKAQAIEAYAGKPGTPDARPGAYKAPGASAFSGGRLYERPPEPKVEAKDLD